MTLRTYAIWRLKIAPVLVCAYAIIGCAPKLEQTPVSPVAPTVRKPALVKPVDIQPVVDRSRQVEEGNRQLSAEIAKQKAIGYDLKRQLQIARVAAVVTSEQWDAMEAKVSELQTSRDQLEILNGDQREALVMMNSALAETGGQVSIVQASLDDAHAALDDANLNIAALNTINQNVQKERDSAVKAFAESSGTISELKKSRAKWAGATIMALSALVIASYLLLKP